MPDLIRITDSSRFTVSDYERLVSQMPRFTLRGIPLLDYMNKMATSGELHALVVDQSPKGLLGFYANDAKTRRAYLSLIVVDRFLRGQGQGKRLFEVMLEACYRAGMSSIALNVVRDNNQAVDFYRKHGFILSGAGQDESRVLMTKEL